ncbi:formate dehydrogenase accessory sulfurtransferase FdhD [Oceanobacillus sp. CAU 1775]
MRKLENMKLDTIRIKGEHQETMTSEIAAEFPLTIMVDGNEFATIVCSPNHLQDLTVGFLAAEGVIRTFKEVKKIHIDEYTGFAHVELVNPVEPTGYDHSSRFIGSCCGKSRQFYFKSDARTARTITSRLQISTSECLHLMKELMNNSTEFSRTGGVHNAALANTNELLMVRTDIGRHNTLDKIFGAMLQERISPKDKLLVFSGRVSSEVLLKASKMGIGLILSKSALTDLAVELALDLGITIIGFARKDQMTIYTYPERISDIESNTPKSSV